MKLFLQLRSQLMEAERLLESSSSAPLALQPLLRRLLTHSSYLLLGMKWLMCCRLCLIARIQSQKMEGDSCEARLHYHALVSLRECFSVKAFLQLSLFHHIIHFIEKININANIA